ncbi:MAG: hypothetical protein LC723_13400 [Actinobacteria bacterium]|nr:hypothetical protein [Actinomycetota bacterium]
MPIQILATGCCGMKEIDNLSLVATAQGALREVAPRLYALKPAFVLFSGVTKRFTSDHASSRVDNYGQAFADFITKNNLGPVLATAETKNPNSHNHITVWIWQMDRSALHTWMRQNGYNEVTGWNQPA